MHGEVLLKADPFGFAFEMPPLTASIVARRDYDWRDAPVDARSRRSRNAWFDRPMAIYEVHLGSWARVPEEHDRSLTYRELADRLIPYVKEMGYTHIELLPVMEHPFSRLVGLPGHRLLRADQPIRHARRFQGVRRRAATQHGIGVHSRLGAGAFSEGRARRWRSSTARRSTSTPIRGRASTATGAR